MASSAPVQKGNTIYLGFGSYTYSVILTDDVTITPGADVKVIKDENNATTSVQIYDPSSKIEMSGIIKGSTFPTILLIGSTLAINGVNYRLEKYDIKLARTEAKLSLTGISESSMSY